MIKFSVRIRPPQMNAIDEILKTVDYNNEKGAVIRDLISLGLKYLSEKRFTWTPDCRGTVVVGPIPTD